MEVEVGAVREVPSGPHVERRVQPVLVVEIQTPVAARVTRRLSPALKGQIHVSAESSPYRIVEPSVNEKPVAFPKGRLQRGVPVVAGRPVISDIAYVDAVAAIAADAGCQNAGAPSLRERKHVERKPHHRDGTPRET